MRYRELKIISAMFLIVIVLCTDTKKIEASENRINFVGDLSNMAVVNSVESYANMIPQNIVNAMNKQHIKCRISNSIRKDSGQEINENETSGLYVTYFTYGSPGDQFIYLKNSYDGSEALAHEVGHFVDRYEGDLSKTDEWKVLYEQYGSKVSSYAGTNAVEGFAETFSATILYPDIVKGISEELYQYMQGVIVSVK